MQQAKAAAKNPLFEFTAEARPVTKGRFQSPFQQSAESLSAGKLNEIMLKAYNQIKVNEKIVSAHAMAMIIETESNFVSSNGSDVKQNFLMVQSDYSATANKDDIYQRRTNNHCMQIGMEEFDEDLVMARAQQVGEQALELLNAEDCPTETTNLVLAPDQMMLQIHESIGHALEVDRILGDERNYAGWSFVREEKKKKGFEITVSLSQGAAGAAAQGAPVAANPWRAPVVALATAAAVAYLGTRLCSQIGLRLKAAP